MLINSIFREESRHEKNFYLFLSCLLCLILGTLSLAQSNYDERKERFENSEDYNEMINFEKDILNALYPSSANEPMLVEIDFSKAVKTYPYTPEDLVNQLENETMLSDL